MTDDPPSRPSSPATRPNEPTGAAGDAAADPGDPHSGTGDPGAAPAAPDGRADAAINGTGRSAPDPPWRRLSPGMLLVEPVRDVIRFIPMLVILLFAGSRGDDGPPWGLIGTVLVVGLGIARYLSTRYRITPTLVEVRRGILQRTQLAVPRDRIRTLDVSAHPLQRLLRLVRVDIGTGSSHAHARSVRLDGLPAAAVPGLRAELLHRAPGAGTATPSAPPNPAAGAEASDVAIAAGAIDAVHPGLRPGRPGGAPSGTSGEPPGGTGGRFAGEPDAPPIGDDAGQSGGQITGQIARQPGGDTAARPGSELARQPGGDSDAQPGVGAGSPDGFEGEIELARLHPRWIALAPATLSGVVTGAVLIGFGLRLLHEARLNPADFGPVEQILGFLRGRSVWLDVAVAAAAVLLLVTVLSVAGYVLSFSGFRLTRHPGGTLQVTRGLLTTRSTSLSEHRLRGVQRREPLVLRWAGG
ncbi:PH domain-containing protein, partial [Nakamurella sp.]|uniref:PH domain-containing protein n=1 Tax=Nakamurella sp. TaxID=1869182 RepID=UPI003B3A48D9